MGNKYLSEVIQEHKEEILENNDLILMTAGVGAGKNTWVQKELVKELNDDETILFITSRKMIKEQALKDRAFCDNFNDLDMLEAVGEAYVMANAPQEVKERVGHVTASHNHDGIALVLEKLGISSFE